MEKHYYGLNKELIKYKRGKGGIRLEIKGSKHGRAWGNTPMLSATKLFRSYIRSLDLEGKLEYDTYINFTIKEYESKQSHKFKDKEYHFKGCVEKINEVKEIKKKNGSIQKVERRYKIKIKTSNSNSKNRTN